MDADFPQPADVGGLKRSLAGSSAADERRNHIYALIAGTVLVLGLVRALLVVGHRPVLGYTDGALASFPPQLAGGLLLAAIAAIAVVTALALRRHPVASLIHALLFFLIVADPVATLWLNSTRMESVFLVAAYALVTMVGVVKLGAGKRLHRALLLAALVGVVAFALVAAMAQPRTAPTALVPAAAPDDTRLHEPLRSLRELARHVAAGASFEPAGLPVSSTARTRHIADLPPHIMSFTGLIARIPVAIWMIIAMTMILTLPFAIVALRWSNRNPMPTTTPAIPAVFTALVAIAAYAVIARAVGLDDAGRAQSVGWLAMLAAIMLLPLMAWHLAQDWWTGPVSLVCGVAIVLLAAGWFAWTRQQGVAIGALERMTPGPNRTLEASGWALDPRGVKRVYVTVGGGPATDAVLGTERRDLQAAYPGYPDSLTGGFQISIPSNAWRQDELLRVFVENRTGAINEIDRAAVRAAP